VVALNPSHEQSATILRKLDELFEAEALDEADDKAAEQAAAAERTRLDADPSLPRDEDILAELAADEAADEAAARAKEGKEDGKGGKGTST
jgi:hypothetical protein